MNALRTIGWGVFCACSWTWCIGMFLPVIMINRYGWPGWVVFAIPNVLGCAAFGYVLKNRANSKRLIENHRPMMIGFSAVTVGFHLLFIMILAQMTEAQLFIDSPLPAVGLAVTLYAVALAVSFLNDRAWLIAAAAVYIISLSVFLVVNPSAWDTMHASGDRSQTELMWLLPVIAIGFLMCPYLDLTFHRALQKSPSRHAFGVFGVTFTIMIVLTIFIWFSSRTLHALALLHIVIQMIFTMGAHLREMRVATERYETHARRMIIAAPLLAILILPMMQWVLLLKDPGESTYLRYMVFYPLVFPLHALVFMGPWRGVRMTKKRLLIAGCVCVAMMPFFEVGFLMESITLGGLTLEPASIVLAVPITLAVAWLVGRGVCVRTRRQE